MNKYFSKAVFYSERKNIIYSLMAYSLIYAYAIYHLLLGLSKHQLSSFYLPPSPVQLFSSFLPTFIAISLISVFSSYSEKHKKYSFMLTQPYSRDSILVTKNIAIILSYLIPTIIYGILSSLIVIVNKAHYVDHLAKGNFSTPIVGIALAVLCVVAVISFVVMLLQFLQMCFGNSAAAFVLPPIMLMILFLSVTLAAQFASKNLGPVRDWLKFAVNPVFHYPGTGIGISEYKSLSQLVKIYFTNFNGLVSLVLILISLLMFYICTILNRKIKAENTSNIFMFSFTEIVFKIVFSLFITIASTLILSAVLYYLAASVKGMNYSTYLINKYGLQGKENIEHTIYLALNILWIPVFPFVYRFVGNIINRRRTA